MAFEKRFNNFPAGWQEVADAWGNMNSRYFDLYEDFPAWYVENSNSALLSAAAWQCGYTAICEVDVEKKRYTGERGRPAGYNGRMDLEIHINDVTYWIEAKRRCFSLSTGSGNSLRHSALSRAIRTAWKDAENCKKSDKKNSSRMVGIVFFSAHIDSDASERQPRTGSPRVRERLVEDEIVRMLENMQVLGQELKKTIYSAVFAKTNFGIHRGWQGYSWPAAYGMCALMDG